MRRGGLRLLFCSRRALGARLLEMRPPAVSALCASHALRRLGSSWALSSSLEPATLLSAAQPCLPDAAGADLPAASEDRPALCLPSPLERYFSGLSSSLPRQLCRMIEQVPVSISTGCHCTSAPYK